jgi:hypothetical protein
VPDDGVYKPKPVAHNWTINIVTTIVVTDGLYYLTDAQLPCFAAVIILRTFPISKSSAIEVV